MVFRLIKPPLVNGGCTNIGGVLLTPSEGPQKIAVYGRQWPNLLQKYTKGVYYRLVNCLLKCIERAAGEIFFTNHLAYRDFPLPNRRCAAIFAVFFLRRAFGAPLTFPSLLPGLLIPTPLSASTAQMGLIKPP